MRHKVMVGLLFLCLAGQGALAAMDLAVSFVPDAKQVGQGRLSVLFWDVYDAKLYAPDGTWSQDKPFMLSLHYFREIKGVDIADRSVQEIRNQGFDDEVKLAAWHTQMKHLFPDVEDGSILSAVFIPGEKIKFFDRHQPIGVVNDAMFVRLFADIWLSEKTSRPDLRRQLLGAL